MSNKARIKKPLIYPQDEKIIFSFLRKKGVSGMSAFNPNDEESCPFKEICHSNSLFHKAMHNHKDFTKAMHQVAMFIELSEEE